MKLLIFQMFMMMTMILIFQMKLIQGQLKTLKPQSLNKLFVYPKRKHVLLVVINIGFLHVQNIKYCA